MTALTLADARAVIEAAEKRANEIGQPMNIAVVDAGGNLIAHVRPGRSLDRQHRHIDQQGMDIASL